LSQPSNPPKKNASSASSLGSKWPAICVVMADCHAVDLQGRGSRMAGKQTLTPLAMVIVGAVREWGS
jgi:hypothetical protein